MKEPGDHGMPVFLAFKARSDKATGEFAAYVGTVLNLLNQAQPFVTDSTLHAKIDYALKNPPSPGLIHFELTAAEAAPPVATGGA